jgi:hypothetical protein
MEIKLSSKSHTQMLGEYLSQKIPSADIDIEIRHHSVSVNVNLLRAMSFDSYLSPFCKKHNLQMIAFLPSGTRAVCS